MVDRPTAFTSRTFNQLFFELVTFHCESYLFIVATDRSPLSPLNLVRRGSVSSPKSIYRGKSKKNSIKIFPAIKFLAHAIRFLLLKLCRLNPISAPCSPAMSLSARSRTVKLRFPLSTRSIQCRPLVIPTYRMLQLRFRQDWKELLRHCERVIATRVTDRQILKY